MKGSKEIYVLLAFFAIIIASVGYFLSRTADTEEYFPPRSSYSPRTTGYKALYELLSETGFEVSRFAGNEYHYPTDGCVVVGDGNSTDPSAMFGLGLDMRQVKGWLTEGGSLVVLSEAEYLSLGTQIFDVIDGNTPDGIFEIIEELEGTGTTHNEIEAQLEIPTQSLAHYSSEGGEGNTGAMFNEYLPGQVFHLGENKPALWKSVENFEIADQYVADTINGTALLTAVSKTVSTYPVVVYRKVGEGEIFWVTCPEIMANDWIDREDNHRVALALIDRAARGGPVVFDEHLHGYSNQSFNAGSLITKTTGGHLLLLFILAVVIIFMGQAVRPALFHPQKTLPRRQASEMVLAQASLYRRAALQSSIAARLVEGLQRSYMKANHLAVPPSHDELAQALTASPQLGAQLDPLLLDYLQGNAAPASPDGLFRLAKACHQLQLRLG